MIPAEMTKTNYEAIRCLEYKLLEQRNKLDRIYYITDDRNVADAIDKIDIFLELLASVQMSVNDWRSGYRHVKIAMNDSLLVSLSGENIQEFCIGCTHKNECQTTKRHTNIVGCSKYEEEI